MEANAATVSNARQITVTINGTTYEREVEARKLLVHFLRDDLDLTGTPHRLRHRQLRRVLGDRRRRRC